MRLLIILFCCFQFNSIAQKVFVLFVGNSLTYFSDTPGKLKKMLEINGDSVLIEQCVAPGFRLWTCFEGKYGVDMLKCVEDKLADRKWDYVIIQNPNDGFLNPRQEMKSVIQKFDSMAIKNGAKLMMYMPYASDAFPKIYCGKEKGEIVCSPTLYKNARQALDSINTFVNRIPLSRPLIQAPIGEAHYQYDARYSKSDLYMPDFGHPSELGAYLHACCYYYLLTNTFYESMDADTKKKDVEQIIKNVFSTHKK
jgi:hypothetical protein